jgi:type IV pilus assembly protein PilM
VFGRNFIGLEIRRQGLRAVSLKRKGSRRILCGGQTLQLSEGVVSPTARELNVLEPQVFVDGIKEVLLPIAGRDERVALCLPDAAGHIFLLDVETPFKNRQQGLDIIRWQLKDMLPENFRNIALDFQELYERESGSRRLLVSVIDRTIRQQYEDLLAGAGFSASLIDFQSLQTYNCYRSKLDLGKDFIFVALNQRQLSLLTVQNGNLDFHRAKTGMESAEAVFQEINRSLVTYRSGHSTFARSILYLQTDWEDTQSLSNAVASAFDREVQNLPSPLTTLAGRQNVNLSPAEAAGMAAAIGVAESLMWDKG